MIAVISDTHIPGRAKRIPERFLRRIGEAEIAVHAGDLTSSRVLKDLQGRAQNLFAVKGNCDSLEIPESESFGHQGISIGVYHGTGITPRGHHDTLSESIARELDVEILIHGHTHRQESLMHEGKLLVNPGSATGVGGGTSEKGTPRMTEIEVEDRRVVVVEHAMEEEGFPRRKEFELE